MIIDFQFESLQEKAIFSKTAVAKELMQTDFSKLNPFFRRMLIMRMFLLPVVELPVKIKVEGQKPAEVLSQ